MNTLYLGIVPKISPLEPTGSISPAGLFIRGRKPIPFNVFPRLSSLHKAVINTGYQQALTSRIAAGNLKNFFQLNSSPLASSFYGLLSRAVNGCKAVLLTWTIVHLRAKQNRVSRRTGELPGQKGPKWFALSCFCHIRHEITFSEFRKPLSTLSDQRAGPSMGKAIPLDTGLDTRLDISIDTTGQSVLKTMDKAIDKAVDKRCNLVSAHQFAYLPRTGRASCLPGPGGQNKTGGFQMAWSWFDQVLVLLIAELTVTVIIGVYLVFALRRGS